LYYPSVSSLTIASRRVAAAATDAICRTAGRRTVIRTARYVLLRARLDFPNDMAVNGELGLQRWVLELAPSGSAHVADIGANVGRWSRSLLDQASRSGRAADVRLHAFEPESRAYARLERSLAGTGAVLSPMALSDRSGTSAFHVVGAAAGTNSLHAPAGVPVTTETVPTGTLDSYAAEARVPGFALVKIDTEGHDLAVLRGARGLLAQRRVAVVQFEYNHRWVYARAFLRDAFDLLAGVGYRLGKLTPRGVEFYPGWDPDLETFVEGNYVACTPVAADMLPAVRWWKA
jgi:FkbM family methyltransferase